MKKTLRDAAELLWTGAYGLFIAYLLIGVLDGRGL